MDKQKRQYRIRKIFFIILLLVSLLGVFYVPDWYTDRFFTSGMIWLGLTIPVFSFFFFFLIGGCISFSRIWLYLIVLVGFTGWYSWVGGVFPMQQISYMLVLVLSGILFCHSGDYLKWKEINTCVALVAVGQALWGIAQYMGCFHLYNTRFPVTGTFDNPAGLAMYLTVSFPFVVPFVFSTIGRERIAGILVACILVLGILLSGSRTGLVALICITGITAWQHFKPGRKIRNIILITGVVMGCLLAAGLYYLKKDSADGRLLIWRCTWEMIREKPLLGRGPGSFGGEYMLYQADYLHANPDARSGILADNVKHPFNEYLKIWAEWGFAGLLVVGIGVVWIIRLGVRHKPGNHPALISLIALLVCGLFSYPLNYPAICVLLALDFSLLVREGNAGLCLRKGGKMAGLFVSAGLLVFTIYWHRMEVCWTLVAHRALAGEQDVLPLYARLYPFLRENPFFLYNYGAELHEREMWPESVAELEKCSRLLNDTDVQILLADNYSRIGCPEQAEKCLLLASRMCPNRFLPLYRLVKLYDSAGRYKDAEYWAGIIVRKPVKVGSYMVNKIKKQMADYLKNRNIESENFY